MKEGGARHHPASPTNAESLVSRKVLHGPGSKLDNFNIRKNGNIIRTVEKKKKKIEYWIGHEYLRLNFPDELVRDRSLFIGGGGGGLGEKFQKTPFFIKTPQ